MKYFVIIFISFGPFLFFSATQSFACLGPPLHTASFLKTLPNDAVTEDIVAKVRVTKEAKTTLIGDANIIMVEVVEGIKGAVRNQIIKVKTPRHNCAADSALLKKNDIYYIAGKLNFIGTFTGEWRGDGQRPKERKKTDF